LFLGGTAADAGIKTTENEQYARQQQSCEQRGSNPQHAVGNTEVYQPGPQALQWIRGRGRLCAGLAIFWWRNGAFHQADNNMSPKNVEIRRAALYS